VRLYRISCAVADYKQSTEFYTDLTGLEVRNGNGKTQASLNINNVGGISIPTDGTFKSAITRRTAAAVVPDGHWERTAMSKTHMNVQRR